MICVFFQSLNADNNHNIQRDLQRNFRRCFRSRTVEMGVARRSNTGTQSGRDRQSETRMDKRNLNTQSFFFCEEEKVDERRRIGSIQEAYSMINGPSAVWLFW